jgi:hypothetical protein
MSPDTAEHQVRDGAPPDDGPLGGPPGPSAETDRGTGAATPDSGADAPSGLPDDAPESMPLGTQVESPDGEGEPARGDEAMPGIPTDGEPPSAG